MTQSGNSVQLTWTPIPYTNDDGYYEISYATSAGGPYTTHGGTTNKSASSYVVTGLDPDTAYYFVVRTYTAAHAEQENNLWSDYSLEIQTTTQAQPDLVLSSLSLSDNSICLGQQVTIYATEKNQGSLSANSHILTYYDDNTSSGYINSVSSDIIISLAVNAITNQDHTFTTTTSGMHFIKALADAAGQVIETNEMNNGRYITLTVTADTAAPTGSININNGATYATSTSVVLNLNAIDSGVCAGSVSQMRFSNDGTDWGVWENYTVSKAYTLSDGDGAKTVYVEFKDNSGNSGNSFVDGIIMDDTPPTGAISIITMAETQTMTSAVTLELSAKDDISGVGQMLISNQADFTGASWEAYDVNRDWILESDSSVYVRFRDNAGNISTIYSSSLSPSQKVFLPLILKYIVK